jgi:single-strand DNA-binding protein
MNRTQIIGNLGADAEVRVLESGQAAISFSVGVTERWTDKQGVKQEKTDWFRCTLWKPSDKTAIAQYLKKGTKVLIEGKASARAWQGQDGALNANLELNVQNLEFLSAVQQTQPGAAPAQAPAPNHKAAIEANVAAQEAKIMNTSDKIAAMTEPAADDDLPF